MNKPVTCIVIVLLGCLMTYVALKQESVSEKQAIEISKDYLRKHSKYNFEVNLLRVHTTIELVSGWSILLVEENASFGSLVGIIISEKGEVIDVSYGQ